MDLGVTATWLSPVFKSPMFDFGYDITDFKQVDPFFGTNNDLMELFQKAKEKGIKIILDFVATHSGNQSEWFLKSIKRIHPYTNYYIWADAKVDNVTGERKVPTNWVNTMIFILFIVYISMHLYILFFTFYKRILNFMDQRGNGIRNVDSIIIISLIKQSQI